MSAIFLCMTVGSVPLVLLLRSRPYGLQEASIVIYTLFVVFFTFATTGSGPAGGNVPGYKFTCPAVEPQVPRLLWRHLIFLIALFVLQTGGAGGLTPHLPDSWNMQGRKGTPFEIDAIVPRHRSGNGPKFVTNKSLLNRAHREFSA